MRNLKRVLSLALALVMVLGMMAISAAAATYTDADQIEYKEAVEVMTEIGLYEGNDDGSLAPKQVLTRGMAATILARIMLKDKVDTLIATKQIFDDVKVTDWYAEEVEYCYNTGLIAGNGDGTFNPDGELTGIAFAKLLLVALGYDADEQGYVGGDWSSNIAIDALDKDMYIKGVDIADKLTREQAAQMILQVMDETTVYYLNSFDKATGEATLVGPLTSATTFGQKYYDLIKGTGVADDWGRPALYAWKYESTGDIVYNKMETPVAKYNVAVSDCQLALDLGLKADAPSQSVFTNGLPGTDYIDLDGMVANNGGQGVQIEVYKTAKRIVRIDTYLAEVDTVVTELKDAGGHVIRSAKNDLTAYGVIDADPTDNYLAGNKYAKGDMILVNYNIVKDKYYDLGVATTTTGAQTIIWQNAAKHTVAGVTYADAAQYVLNEAGLDHTKQYTWFFDQFGNLIGSASIAASYTYATIADIQWYNPAAVNGYALATLVYADGSTEQVVVSKINNNTLSYTWFAGDYATGAVSMNYGANTQYIGKALFAVSKNDAGVVTLTEVATSAAPVTVSKGNPVVVYGAFNAGGIYIDDSTQFLVRTSVGGKFVYTPVTGYNQIPSLTGATVYSVELDGDYAADIVYMYGGAATYGAEKLVYVNSLAYSYMVNNDAVVTLKDAQVNGVTTDVKMFTADLGTLVEGEMFVMADDGDGIYEVITPVGTVTLQDGSVAQKMTAGTYSVLNNALWVNDGNNVYYNITNTVTYGNWTNNSDIVVVSKTVPGVNNYAVVSAVYVL